LVVLGPDRLERRGARPQAVRRVMGQYDSVRDLLAEYVTRDEAIDRTRSTP